MAGRPLGIEPIREREFNVVIIVPEEKTDKPTRKEKLSEWFYHIKNFSFGRGSVLELDLEDDMIEFLERDRWIVCRKGEYFFTKKGSQELVAFAKREIARIEKSND